MLKHIGETPSGLSALEVRDVRLTFGGVVALNDVSLSFRSGVLGLVGPNGAGKSSLLNVLSGFARPERGSVSYCGRRLERASASARSRLGIGRSFQEPVHVASMTVRENLMAGARADRISAEAAELVGTLGLEHWFGRDVTGLPYGVRKLLDIGRALIREPRLLFCDEPLSGLDESERDNMEGILAKIAERGVSLIVVEHDVARIRRLADRMIALEAGTKIAEGTPDEVLGDPSVIAAFTGVVDEGEVA